MSMFGSGGGSNASFSQQGGSTFGANSANPMKDIEVPGVADDSTSKIAFSPNADYLIASSWDNTIRCWEISKTGPVAKASQSHTGPILDCCWTADGTKVITAGSDRVAKLWDLCSNQTMDIAMHEQPIKTVNWIQGNNYSCVMTGSWDKTLKFWDTRTPNPILSFQLQERCYCADVMFPMAVIGQADRKLSVYYLENQPSLFKTIESPLKYQHRCLRIFIDKSNKPSGFALGSIEGRVAVHYMNTNNPGKDNFTFKCHRSNPPTNLSQSQEIYAVNDISFHPHYGTLSTVGSDGKFSFWDKDARTKLKTSESMELPIVSCCFNYEGTIFAYAVSYDWSKGHEKYSPQMKNYIYLRKADDDLKPRNKKK